MAPCDPFDVLSAVLNLTREAVDASVFLGHRRQEYGQCLVALLSYRGRRNVTAEWKPEGGTTGIPLRARVALPYGCRVLARPQSRTECALRKARQEIGPRKGPHA
jgi:hypothetical protein